MAQQFNDDQCRRADDPAHRCHDKHGANWASPVRPARPGSMCWFETIARLEDERLAERAALAHLAQSVTLDEFAQPYDSWSDVDYRESSEVR